MTVPPPLDTVFVYDSTHHAIWAEEVAEKAGIPSEVVPAPTAAEATCNLALRTLPARVPELAEALEREGVRFRLHPPPTP